ncbi:tellurite resistance TerB family protein [Modicisalibacter tunisiensis]|uniref:tellurite resistance TerB family protein n=1 Tax=Modicisalibacter tunisiensis TaxID=390637 RepID=UPI0007921BF1|nr:tellurite resistance TerB family protein [Modicisalibacter tunisiensis]KXS37418.1 MAG: hypothetical protein AWU55_2294 [Halomonadaceae bacterium T82-2]MBZ9537700.1 tellurite resistance TerB family protein [Modicisalibacter tunisiensis]
MNARGVLEELMQQAGSRGRRGPDPRRLVPGSALGILLGSHRGRRAGRKAVKYGALAGLGMLAWRAWQSHQAERESPEPTVPDDGEPLEQLQGEAREARSMALLKAMIAAARADGHIDAAERTQLVEQINALGADPPLLAWVDEQLQAPLDAEQLAMDADSPQAAREMYLASVAIIDVQNPMERAWLDQLAASLGLGGDVIEALEARTVNGG